MTRRIGMVFVAIGAISVSLASVSDAEAFGRRNGCGSWGGRGSHGSHGGSFGGFFSRARNGSHGGYGSNGGYGSHGGRYHNGCGSHGGSYHNGGEVIVEEGGTESAQRVDQQGEVRYFRGETSRETFRSDRDRDMAAPAPPRDENQGRLDGERRDVDGRGEVRTDAQGEAQIDTRGDARADAQGEAQTSIPAPGEPDGGQGGRDTNQNPTDSNRDQNQSSNQQNPST